MAVVMRRMGLEMLPILPNTLELKRRHELTRMIGFMKTFLLDATVISSRCHISTSSFLYGRADGQTKTVAQFQYSMLNVEGSTSVRCIHQSV
jgi:hypothetical protein